MISFVSFANIFLLLSAFAILRRYATRPSRLGPLPPGPPRDPFIGHLRWLFQNRNALEVHNRAPTLHRLSETYGDLVYLECFGQGILVIDSADVAADLLVRRSASHSSRPRLPLFELFGVGNFLVFLPDCLELYKQRGMLQRFFSKSNTGTFERVQSKAAVDMVESLLDSKSDKEKASSVRRFALATIGELVYGVREEHRYDALTEEILPYLKLDAASTALGSVFPTYVSLLRLLPPYNKPVKLGNKIVEQVANLGLDICKSNLDTDPEVASSLAGQLLTDLNTNGKSTEDNAADMDRIKNMGTSAIFATESITATLMNFIFCALRHPEVQAKAQREIDSVVGPDRLPSLADRASMPYVEAVVQESLRWQPPFPIPALRMSKEDDVYKGMYIPKGTIIIVNDAGMAKDTRVYKNPENFNPDRYMPVDNGGHGEPFFNPYGYGRRICPGRHVSDTAVWMAISALLASCAFSPAKDKHGMAVLPRIEYGDTLSVVDLLGPFPVEVAARRVSTTEKTL